VGISVAQGKRMERYGEEYVCDLCKGVYKCAYVVVRFEGVFSCRKRAFQEGRKD